MLDQINIVVDRLSPRFVETLITITAQSAELNSREIFESAASCAFKNFSGLLKSLNGL